MELPIRKKIVLGVAALAIVGFTYILFVFFMVSPDPVEYHNAQIDSLTESCDVIHVRTNDAEYGRGGSSISINDKERIQWLLQLILLPAQDKYGKMHKCSGHLTITFVSGPETHRISYDHGIGIYPIAAGNTPGFMDLAPEACTELNEYLLAEGFTFEDLGIYE